jgi:hypothetical protein
MSVRGEEESGILFRPLFFPANRKFGDTFDKIPVGF